LHGAGRGFGGRLVVDEQCDAAGGQGRTHLERRLVGVVAEDAETAAGPPSTSSIAR
jgi:hypothetical protein